MPPFLFRRATAKPLQRVERYRGTATGWQPIGAPRDPARAAYVADTLRRILPEATVRTISA